MSGKNNCVKCVKHLIIIFLFIFFSFVIASCGQNPEIDDNKNNDKGGDEIVEEMRDIFPEAIKAEKLYIVNQSGKYSENLLLAGIQGLAAKSRSDQVYVNVGSNINYIKILKEDFGISETEFVKNVWELLPKYMDIFQGYILYSNNNDNSDPSINVAASLAGPMKALIVGADIEENVKALGFNMLLDVRGKDQEWLLSQDDLMKKLSEDIAIEQNPAIGMNLKDFAVMADAACFYTEDAALREKFLSRLSPNSPVLGWNSASFHFEGRTGEGAFIAQASKNQCFTIPSHNFNLSTFIGLRLEKYRQKAKRDASVPAEKKHYVCFVMTDGDNINWLMGNFNASQWYGNKNRGSFKMGWGVSPVLIDAGAPALKYLYDSATENDGFIAQVSGLGYMYPALLDEKTLDNHIKMLNDYMSRSDLNIIQVVDENNFSNENGMKLWDKYTKQPDIDGVFYIGGPYHAFNGQILMVNDKPVISTRYSLWRGFDTPETLADKLNKGVANPIYQEGYSVVSVHAWYETAPGVMGNAMNEVEKCINLLDKSNVEVVTPQELLNLVKNNMKKRLSGN